MREDASTGPADAPIPAWVGRLQGAPLDFVKTVAAVLMVLEHANTILFNGAYLPLWRLGRASLPLFAFVLAVQALRGVDRGRMLGTLLLAGILAQPVYAAAFNYGTREANILFTLAGGFALAHALLRAGDPARILVLTGAAAAVFAIPGFARSGVDFGWAGLALPGALALAILHPARFGGPLLAVWFALHWGTWKPPGETMLTGAGLDLLSGLVGVPLVVGAALGLAGRPRFLSRYALHVFYPGHLLALVGLRAALA